jgi:hypothetical protein
VGGNILSSEESAEARLRLEGNGAGLSPRPIAFIAAIARAGGFEVQRLAQPRRLGRHGAQQHRCTRPSNPSKKRATTEVVESEESRATPSSSKRRATKA